MSKRRVDNAATTKMEREVRFMKVKTMKSELESFGVSLLEMVEKDNLIDALSHARRDTGHQVAPSSSSSQMPALLRDFAQQFEDADVPDLARDAMTLVKAAWDGSVKAEEEGTPLTRTIKRGSAEFDVLKSDYVKTLSAETSAMVGDAFNAVKFMSDANTAFQALKSLDFAKLGTIHYKHILCFEQRR